LGYAPVRLQCELLIRRVRFDLSDVQEMELMLRPVQDLLMGTSMSMGTRGSTTGTMMMLTMCFDHIIMNITEAMMRTMNLTMAVMLKCNASGFQAESKLRCPSNPLLHLKI